MRDVAVVNELPSGAAGVVQIKSWFRECLEYRAVLDSCLLRRYSTGIYNIYQQCPSYMNHMIYYI